MEAVDGYSLHGQITKPLSAVSEEFLILQAKSGDRSAFDELWTRHSSKAFKMAYRITRNREDAEDVIQDAWVRAHLHLNAFDGRATFSTWVIRIAINSALQILRRKRTRPEISVDIADGDTPNHWEFVDQRKSVEVTYAERESEERLRRAISCLRPSLRHVVEIYHSHERSLKEVADLAGISVSATKGRLARARRILRSTLVPE